MRSLLILTLGMLAASGAQACIPNRGGIENMVGDPHEGPSRTLCLFRGSDGQRVCHSRSVWDASLVAGLDTRSDGKEVYYTPEEWRQIARAKKAEHRQDR